MRIRFSIAIGVVIVALFLFFFVPVIPMNPVVPCFPKETRIGGFVSLSYSFFSVGMTSLGWQAYGLFPCA